MPYANLGVVDNKGFEATLEYTQQLGKKCFLTVVVTSHGMKINYRER